MVQDELLLACNKSAELALQFLCWGWSPSGSHFEVYIYSSSHSLAPECYCLNCCQYTGCFEGNVTYFRKMLLRLKYTDVTKNTCIQSWMVMEMMAREKYHLAVPHTVAVRHDASSVNCTGPSLSQSQAMQCMFYVKYWEP
jgi:hypothetical protein